MAGDEIPAELRGWWRITESQVWDADALDLLGPALISFGTGRGDRLRMLGDPRLR
jgi:hypothetical protein